MKKILVIFAALSMLLVCMTACSGSEDPGPTPDPKPNPTPSGPSSSDTQSVYDLLDELADKEYSEVEIDIEVATGFANLHSNYVLTQSRVDYTVDKLNLLPTDGNIADLPSNYKTTVTGYALIENGQIVELDGYQDVTIPSYSELRGNFNFDKDNFAKVVSGYSYFEAEVISPSSFYGTYVEMSDLKIKVEYTKSALTKITVSYNTANAAVQTVYKFVN